MKKDFIKYVKRIIDEFLFRKYQTQVKNLQVKLFIAALGEISNFWDRNCQKGKKLLAEVQHFPPPPPPPESSKKFEDDTPKKN